MSSQKLEFQDIFLAKSMDFLTHSTPPQRSYKIRDKVQKELITPEEINKSFDRLLQRKYLAVDSQLIDDLPKLTPYLDKRYLVGETEIEDKIIRSYRKEFGNATVSYTFLIPKEKKEAKIPTFGNKAKKTLLIIVGLAVEQKNLTPGFRKCQTLRLTSKREIDKKDYAVLNNILQTFAYATYELESKKGGKEYRREIGHIFNNVKWLGEGKNLYIYVELNRDYFTRLLPLMEGKEKGYRYLLIPKDRLTKTLPMDQENFINYLDSLNGQREVYPVLIKTIFMEKLGYTNKALKKMGPGQIASILNNCLETARKSGRLRDHKFEYGENISFKNILGWKLKLYLSKDLENSRGSQGK